MELDELVEVLLSERCVLFLGSGVSVAAPSAMPSAYDLSASFLGELARGILDAPQLDEILDRGVLPENLYGTCERSWGEHVYGVWSALELWKEDERNLGPNPGHLAAVHIAARAVTPILTPNFDTFFEAAAASLELPAVTSVARPGHPFSPPQPTKHVTAIWKLHGTAPEPTSVYSSVRTLTSPTPGVRKSIASALRGDARVVFAGYSGRDLDLLPLVASGLPERVPAIWIDLGFSDPHRSELLVPAAVRVTEAFEDVARAYAQRIGGLLGERVESARALGTSPAYEGAARRVRSRIMAEFAARAKECSGADQRANVVGELLINAGMSGQAIRVLATSAPTGRVETERARLLAKALWETGKLEESRRVAIAAIADGPSRVERMTLQFALHACDARAAVPPQGFSKLTGASPRELLRIGLRALRLLALATIGVPRPAGIPEPTRTPFVEGRLEHRVRVLGALQATATRARIVRGPVRAALALAWRMVQRKSLRFGYAEGVGNAGRYLARLGARQAIGYTTIHEFLGHRLGMAIAYRDAALDALEADDYDLARSAYAAGVSLARVQSDPILLLTFAQLAEALGEPFPEIGNLLASIEAPWAKVPASD